MRSAKASRGQILIMVAAFAVVLTGMVGLSIDLGYAFAQRRTVQNAADSASMAGAHVLAEWSLSNPTLSAKSDVAAMVSANKMGSSTNQTFRCNYVDDAGTNQGSCFLPVPPTATGVHVEVTETHNTFFIRVIPGAPTTVTTSASATAHIQEVLTGADSPFVACGFDTTLASGGTTSILTNGTANAPANELSTGQVLTYPINSGSNYRVEFLNKPSTPTPSPGAGSGTSDYTINPAAVGKTFLLHGPKDVAKCGMTSSKFKGVSIQNDNASKSIPGWFSVDPGDRAGPVRTRVTGVNGCRAGDANPDGCILIVPIATNNPSPSGTEMYVVAAAAFEVSSCSPSGNCHVGTLLDRYQIGTPSGLGQWSGSNGWFPGHSGIIVDRLTK